MTIGFTNKPEHIINAEAYCASLLEHDISLKQIDLNFKSAFRKKYRKDIEKVKTDSNDNTAHFSVDLNRNGVYDILPDGLIHQTAGRRRTVGTKGMLAEHKRFKREEQNARKFFAPIDREIFLYSVFSELEERDVLFDLEQGRLTNEWYHFWNISSHLPHKEASVMLRLMPYLKQLKGNRELTTLALSLILEKEVTSSVRNVNTRFKGDDVVSLGNGRLGFITTAHNDYDDTFVWEITIKDLKENEAALFNNHRPYGQLLERFRELFIPMDVDLEFNFKINSIKKHHSLNEAVLGLGLAL